MSKTYDVAVVGATGAVGECMLEILAARNFPVGKVYALASERSAGKTVAFGRQELEVENLADFDFGKAEVADAIERAVGTVLDAGLRTGDIMTPGCRQVDTAGMGDALCEALLAG